MPLKLAVRAADLPQRESSASHSGITAVTIARQTVPIGQLVRIGAIAYLANVTRNRTNNR